MEEGILTRFLHEQPLVSIEYQPLAYQTLPRQAVQAFRILQESYIVSNLMIQVRPSV